MTGSRLAVTCGCALATSSLGIRRAPWVAFRVMSYAGCCFVGELRRESIVGKLTPGRAGRVPAVVMTQRKEER